MDRSVSQGWWQSMRPAVLAVAIVFLATAVSARQRDASARTTQPAAKTRAATTRPTLLAALHQETDGEDGIEIVSGPIDFGELTLATERSLDRAVIVRVTSQTSWALRVVPESELTLGSREAKLFWRSQWSRKFRPLTTFAEVARGTATGPGGALVMLDLKLALGEMESTGQFVTKFGFELVPR